MKKNLTLIVNCGSSSIKLSIFEKQKNKCVAVSNTYIERVKNHSRTLEKFFAQFEKNHSEIFKNISKVGHRVVHGGEKYSAPTRLNAKVVNDLEKLNPLAPLHNPVNISGIKTCMKLLKNSAHYAIFDTAYYSTLSEKAYLYAIPYSLYEKEKIRRYGFHGISHEYVVREATTFLKKKTPLKIISCHLGNGASITASMDGKAIDTSMGFTPLEGLPMGTRSGDIDPAIIFHLGKKMALEKIHNMLEKKSGLLGLSQLSYDMRDLRDAYFGEKRPEKIKAARALSVYCYRIAKYIGGYAVALGGVDCIVFTATIGEKAPYIRSWICEYLAPLGVTMDDTTNEKCTDPKILCTISKKESKTKVFVIPTNEAHQMCKTIWHGERL